MKMLHRALLTGLAFGCTVATAAAQPRPAVLELFTSEGCSSCPPAEAYVAELTQNRNVLPLSFHVDYWDDLGWRDRFSLAAATQRQRVYAQSLRLSSVYTPQAVIDGRSNAVGSNRGAIGRLLDARRDGVSIAIATAAGDVSVELGSSQPATASDVVLIGYLHQAISPIGRGENSGRTLEEFNIVRSLQVIGHWNGRSARFTSSMASLPRDVTDVAVLVQGSGQGVITGAATQSLR
jgi:hypothetical protein